MKGLGAVCLLAVCGLVALGRGDRDEAPMVLDEAAETPPVRPEGLASDPQPCPELHDLVWIAIDFDDPAAGGVIEYFGKTEQWALDALIDGQLEGYLRLDEVFWLFEDGEIERLDDDLAYGETAYFRVDAIRRITLLKDGFPETARQLRPGDRLIPSSGRDA